MNRRAYKDIADRLNSGESPIYHEIPGTGFSEYLEKSIELTVLGAGHVGLCIARQGLLLGYDVILADDREEFVSKDRIPQGIKAMHVNSFDEWEPDPMGRGYYVIATRGPATDEICAYKILNVGCKYCGMLGSRKKAENIKKALLAKGVQPESFERFFSPIGIRIGAQEPMEIAVSVIAEIIGIRRSEDDHIFDPEIHKVFSRSDNGKGVVVTIIDSGGTHPRKKGSKMLVLPDKSIFGSVGGGKLEYQIICDALNFADRSHTASLASYTQKSTYGIAEVSGKEFEVAGDGWITVSMEIQEW